MNLNNLVCLIFYILSITTGFVLLTLIYELYYESYDNVNLINLKLKNNLQLFNNICSNTNNPNGIFCYNYIKSNTDVLNNTVLTCCRPNKLFFKCNYENAISNICSYQKINNPMEILKIVYKYYLILLSFISAFGFMTGLLYFISNCCKYMYNNFCCRKKQKTPDFSFLNKKNRPKYNSIT
jgi:hypothetical protein